MLQDKIDKGVLNNICRQFPRNIELRELSRNRNATVGKVKGILVELSHITIPAQIFIKVLGNRDHALKPSALLLSETAKRIRSLINEVEGDVRSLHLPQQEQEKEIEEALRWRAEITFRSEVDIHNALQSGGKNALDILEQYERRGVPAEAYLEAIAGATSLSEQEQDLKKYAENAAKAKKILDNFDTLIAQSQAGGIY